MNKKLAIYLKEKPGLNRLFNELKNKYISLNRYSGTVKLINITDEESVDISNLLGRKVDINSTLTTSFKEITKKINEGKYKGFSWEELFLYYFNNSIITNSQKKQLYKQEEIEFFDNIIENNKDNKYIKYLSKIIEDKKDLYINIKNRYNTNKEELTNDLNNILLLLSNIPDTPTSLPVYSAYTGNPHYLDLNKPESNLFLKILSYIKEYEYIDKLEYKINLLSEINIYTDPISNYVITYKLIGNNILENLSNKNQVINLNLLNINSIDNIDTEKHKVFIFENPSILTSLINQNVPIIITSGMPNLALYNVLDKLIKNNNELYYNGDFDPEGLLIAEKLKLRYPDLNLICYEKEDYEMCKSNKTINSSRLKKLDNINTNELLVIKNLLLANKIPGYQEKNINKIIWYINKFK